MADPPPQPSPFQTLQANLKSALISTTRTTSALCAEDLPFQRSLDPSFAQELDRQNKRLLALAERVLAQAATSTVAAPRVQDAEELERKWSSVVDVVDSLLERTDGVLDEVRGVIRRNEAEKPAAVQTPQPQPRKKGFQQAANILKPQRSFAHPPDNFATGPWKPILTRKPHARVPLEESLHTEPSADGTQRQMYGDTAAFHCFLEREYNASFYLRQRNLNENIRKLVNKYISYRHPYQTEIQEYQYPSDVSARREPIMYQSYEETTATFVDTEEAVEEMLEELKKAGEIAIDIEHHDQRTYIGVVCLMQISTRERDWIVDTLKPWRRRLECLNEVFADPKILKVLHGSAMDVIWLQRDLGLYLVGVFDTEHACTALHYPKRSLAFLLEKFVNFQAQKQYQLADWRVRPLPKELFDYARSDTHFLLYIYDCLRNELIDNTNPNDPEEGDLMRKVLEGSKRYQLQRYENPFYDAENGLGPIGWYKQLFRTPALLSKQQFAVFKAVHQWRDNTARKEDESLFFVMSNHLLQTLAREMPTKKEMILAATPAHAALVRQNVEQLLAVIADAREKGNEGPEMRDAMAKSDLLADEQHNNRVQARQAVESSIKAKSHPSAVIPAMVDAPELVSTETAKRPAAVELSAVKSQDSNFWGTTLNGSSEHRQSSTEVRLSLPMPEVSAEVFAPNGVTPAKPPPAQEASPAEETETPSKPADEEVFVLREKSAKTNKKRKAQDELRDGADEIALPSADNNAASAKKKSRADRRREKKAQDEVATAAGLPVPSTEKQKAANGFMAALLGKPSGVEEGEEEEEPFDYANAPSVLNPSEKSKKVKKGKKGKMEGVDPYKKAMDAAKGLPRGQKERVGKAGTFKS